MLQYISVIANLFIMGNYFNNYESNNLLQFIHHRLQFLKVLGAREI